MQNYGDDEDIVIIVLLNYNLALLIQYFTPHNKIKGVQFIEFVPPTIESGGYINKFFGTLRALYPHFLYRCAGPVCIIHF